MNVIYKFKCNNERKSALMEAAFSLAVTRGLDKVTIVDIVEEAKTSRVTFYKYFNTAFDIFWEIHKYILNEMGTFFTENIKGGNVIEKIHNFLDLNKTFFIHWSNEIKFTIFFDCYQNHSLNDENYLDFIMPSDFYDQLVYEGVKEGAIKDGEKYRKKLISQVNAIWALMQRLAIKGEYIEAETSYNTFSILDELIESAHTVLKI